MHSFILGDQEREGKSMHFLDEREVVLKPSCFDQVFMVKTGSIGETSHEHKWMWQQEENGQRK